MLFSQFSVERCAHDHAADTGGCGEVRFARLAPRGVEVWAGRISVDRNGEAIMRYTLVLIFVIVTTGEEGVAKGRAG